MKLFGRYLTYKVRAIAFFCFLMILMAAFSLLYQLPLQAVLYPMVLCIVAGIVFLIWEFFKIKEKHERLTDLFETTAPLIHDLPEGDSLLSEDYHKMIRELIRQYKKLADESLFKYNAMTDYYSVWVHQIKTPIASMRLQLQTEDSAFSREMLRELVRIEQYVDMVLTYLRLDSPDTDYVFGQYDLDVIIRPVIKKFRGDFIAKKLHLEYTPICFSVLTDEKWLAFVIEQILSNSVKYTDEGGITMAFEDGHTLCISDTGIGIAPEDLPRIFENGYTGFNGRSHKQASGIGLYLCKRICDNLGHDLRITSQPGMGTEVRIIFKSKAIGVE